MPLCQCETCCVNRRGSVWADEWREGREERIAAYQASMAAEVEAYHRAVAAEVERARVERVAEARRDGEKLLGILARRRAEKSPARPDVVAGWSVEELTIAGLLLAVGGLVAFVVVAHFGRFAGWW